VGFRAGLDAVAKRKIIHKRNENILEELKADPVENK
jgi:hypothetical protein